MRPPYTSGRLTIMKKRTSLAALLLVATCLLAPETAHAAKPKLKVFILSLIHI